MLCSTCLCSSVGRAVDWKSTCRWFDSDRRHQDAGVAHLVERHLAKVEVASSSLVTRSKKIRNAMRSLFHMVPWPSGKARVCKTLIRQFKSGRYLQTKIRSRKRTDFCFLSIAKVSNYGIIKAPHKTKYSNWYGNRFYFGKNAFSILAFSYGLLIVLCGSKLELCVFRCV